MAIFTVATGCGESTGPGSITGTYTLYAIDGIDLTLPVALPIDPACEVLLSPAVCVETLRIEVRSGTVLLSADSSYRIQTLLRRQLPGGASTEVTSNLRGQWSLQGDHVSLVDTLGTHRSGALAGHTLTIDVVPNMDWAYRK
jgi:hypothetical protein